MEAIRGAFRVDAQGGRAHVDEVVRRSVEETVPESLSDYAFPREHWRCIHTNNPMERLNREMRRRTRVVGAFPDGRSALLLVAARLRHVASTPWGLRRYLDMSRLREPKVIEAAAA